MDEDDNGKVGHQRVKKVNGKRLVKPFIKGFCQVKKNPKIREKLGSGWAGQAPTRILFFFWKFCVLSVFFVVFFFVHVSMFFFNLTSPLILICRFCIFYRELLVL